VSDPIPAKTLSDLSWEHLLAQLAKRCHTAQGEVRARALALLDSADSARARGSEIAEARSLRARAEAMPFGGIAEVEESLQRAEKGSILDPSELVAIGETAAGCRKCSSNH